MIAMTIATMARKNARKVKGDDVFLRKRKQGIYTTKARVART
jgi:hypothetical protein